MMQRKLYLVIALLVFPLAACSTATYQIATPIPPIKVAADQAICLSKVADSADPTLRWEPLEGITAPFEIVIYEAIEEDVYNMGLKMGFPRLIRGPEVYRAVDVNKSEHALSKKLDLNTNYLWAVRGQTGEGKLSGWSNFSWDAGVKSLFSEGDAEGNLYCFKTPGAN